MTCTVSEGVLAEVMAHGLARFLTKCTFAEAAATFSAGIHCWRAENDYRAIYDNARNEAGVIRSSNGLEINR